MTATKQAIKERPILFSGEMVRAILEGRKTQTRRVVEIQPPTDEHSAICLPTGWGYRKTSEHGMIVDHRPIRSVYLVGMQLWVRETWADYCPLWYGHWCGHGTQEGKEQDHKPVYKADDPALWIRQVSEDGKTATPNKWRSPIHMPRWASRISLEITGVRVERVQEISEEDAIAEGMNFSERVGFWTSPEGNCDSARWAYRYCWDSINAKRGYSWDFNPFVWVIEFKPIPATREEV